MDPGPCGNPLRARGLRTRGLRATTERGIKRSCHTGPKGRHTGPKECRVFFVLLGQLADERLHCTLYVRCVASPTTLTLGMSACVKRRFEGSGILSIGVLGTASIARKNIAAMHATDGVICAAVASRSLTRAQAYAKEVGVDMAFGSYAELLRDETIRALYNPLPTAGCLCFVCLLCGGTDTCQMHCQMHCRHATLNGQSKPPLPANTFFSRSQSPLVRPTLIKL